MYPLNPFSGVKGNEVDIIDSWEVEGCFFPKLSLVASQLLCVG